MAPPALGAQNTDQWKAFHDAGTPRKEAPKSNRKSTGKQWDSPAASGRQNREDGGESSQRNNAMPARRLSETDPFEFGLGEIASMNPQVTQTSRRPQRLQQLADNSASKSEAKQKPAKADESVFGKRIQGKEGAPNDAGQVGQKAVDPVFGQGLSSPKRGDESVFDKRIQGKGGAREDAGQKAVDPVFGQQFSSMKRGRSMKKKLSVSEHPQWHGRDGSGAVRAGARLSNAEIDSVLPNSPQRKEPGRDERTLSAVRRDRRGSFETDEAGSNPRDFAMPPRRSMAQDDDPFLHETDDVGGGSPRGSPGFNKNTFL